MCVSLDMSAMAGTALVRGREGGRGKRDRSREGVREGGSGEEGERKGAHRGQEGKRGEGGGRNP